MRWRGRVEKEKERREKGRMGRGREVGKKGERRRGGKNGEEGREVEKEGEDGGGRMRERDTPGRYSLHTYFSHSLIGSSWVMGMAVTEATFFL